MSAHRQEPRRVGIVGTGRLAEVLVRAARRFASSIPLTVGGRAGGRGEPFRTDIQDLIVSTPQAVASNAGLLILCVPPETYSATLALVQPHLRPQAIVVSVTNGFPLPDFAAIVRNPVVKVIPTIAHTVGRGVSLVVPGPNSKPDDVAAVISFFSIFSRPIVIDDADNRVASNVAGSFVAIAAAIGDAYVQANVARASTIGPAALSMMAAESFGAVADLVADGRSFAEIVAATATPGGATAAALDVLGSRFPDLSVEMVDATFKQQTAMHAVSAAGASDGAKNGRL